MQSYKMLPDTFSLDDISPHITADKEESIKKLHALWKAGIPVYIYGSFVAQCGMLLTDKKPICANDVDAASLPLPDKDMPGIVSILDGHGFKKKKLECVPYHFIPSFYSFECNDENTKIDFMVKLPHYTDTPNSLELSSFTLHFIDKDPSKIHLEFDNRKPQLEYYCNHAIFQLSPPQLEERGVMRRLLKHINNNRSLYQDHSLNFYYENQKVEKFSADDKAWKKLTDHMKYIFNKKIGKRKFFSYYNEMRRMVKEGTFFTPEAQLLIENFCSIILVHHNNKNKKNLHIRAQNMTKILQQFFLQNPDNAEDFYNIINRLLSYDIYLKNTDTRILASVEEKLKSKAQLGNYTPRLFVPKIKNPSQTIMPTESVDKFKLI